MCEEHGPAERRGRRSSAEFAGLDLKDTPCGETPAHCDDHRHTIPRPLTWLIWSGAAVAFTGILLIVVFRTWRWSLVLALGLVVALIASILNRQRDDAAQRNRPVLPLLPRFDPVEVVEVLPARITLDAQGHYQAETEAATGRMTILATFGARDRDRVRRYRERYRLDRDLGLPFHLGFAVLRGPVAFTSALGAHDPAVASLDGHVQSFPLLTGDSDSVSAQWRKEHTYEVWRQPAAPALPITLTPSLVHAAGRRVLDLDLQWSWNATERAGRRLAIHRIERLQLAVPLAWGDVEHVEGRNVALGHVQALDGQEATQTITWSNQPVMTARDRSPRHTFSVRFERPIEAGSMLRGRVEVEFRGALSGLEGVDLYYPLGHRRREQRAASITTKVVADFELSLARVRYQDVRVVPDGKRPEDAARSKTVVFGDVVPDHHAIIAVTNAISEQGYYVNRVLENPPRTGAQANRVNRHWDIAGRLYRGVYPIDFHLVVNGEEVLDGDIRAQAGSTEARLTVQGAFANPDMEEQVAGVWDQLSDIIAEQLQERALPRGD